MISHDIITKTLTKIKLKIENKNIKAHPKF